jgi:hypothetical protein
MEKTIRVIEDGPAPSGEMECVFFDVKGWHALGSYYLSKFEAAMELLSGNKSKAVELLKDALAFWKELSYIGSLHYLPYSLARAELLFGWSYHIREVEQDIKRAEGYEVKI